MHINQRGLPLGEDVRVEQLASQVRACTHASVGSGSAVSLPAPCLPRSAHLSGRFLRRLHSRRTRPGIIRQLGLLVPKDYTRAGWMENRAALKLVLLIVILHKRRPPASRALIWQTW